MSGNHSNPQYHAEPATTIHLPPNYDPEAPDVKGLRHRLSHADHDVSKKKKNPKQPSVMVKHRGSTIKFPKESMKRIDYVLVYSNKKQVDYPPDSKEYRTYQRNLDLRRKFEAHLDSELLQTQKDVIDDEVFLKIHTPLHRLCQEAENMNLEMPLSGMQNYDDKPAGCGSFWAKFEQNYLITDTEVDFVSAPFELVHKEKFENHDNAEKLFRPALRYFLTHHILINIDIRDEQQEDEDPYAKKGLPYLKMKKVYTDSLILHDETEAINDPTLQDDIKAYKARLGSQFLLNSNLDDKVPTVPPISTEDTRKDLNKTWAKNWFRYQPMWKIRNYFGEKIAFYFAWCGILISSLLLPTLLGLGIFGYGLSISISNRLNQTTNTTANGTLITDVRQAVEDSISIIKEAFDNEATPYFALIICLWGTIFLEIWKRRNYTLAYEWDVNTYEDAEPDRPEFFGTAQRQNPVIPEELEWIYPIYKRVVKYASSFTVLIFMVLLVFICAAAVVLYRVFMTVDYCTGSFSAIECLIVSVIISSVLQAAAIMILGKVYDKLAVILTDWENHRTQTEYDDSLIIKTFAFQFANSYTSLFYIAFFRGINYPNGIFGLGAPYQDNCGTSNNCMAMLSLQVLVLMVLKPLPRFLKDVILPFLKKIWRLTLRPCLVKCCKCSRCCAKVNPGDKVKDDIQREVNNYMKRERMKPPLEDFTLLEYTEKVIMYGFLMLFSASLPLAPLIALVVVWLDIRIDARRMLWWYRRPVAYISQDIGMWYGILQFLNMAGVVTNAFLIAFTSAWGKKYDEIEKLWVVIGFEHIVFTVKFVLAALIPDVPARIALSMKREKYQVGKILSKGQKYNTTSKPAEPRPISSHFSAQLGSMPPIKSLDAGEYDPTKTQQDDPTDSARHRKHKKRHRQGDDTDHQNPGFDGGPNEEDQHQTPKQPDPVTYSEC